MRNVLFLLLCCFSLSASAQWWSSTIRGNGEVITQERDARNFRGVQACCNMQVEISKGDFAVTIEAESNIAAEIATDVSGGRLEINFKRSTNIKTTRPIKVFVTMPELDYLGASSSCNIRTRDTFDGDELEADASSSGDIEVAFTGQRLRARSSSAGKIEISGVVDRVRASASSGGRVDTENVRAKRADANASSGGKVIVFASDELEADASSGGKIRYSGSPRLDVDTSSGGSVKGS